MDKRILSTAAIMAIIAIVLGAFGAHKFKTVLSIESLQAFETGVRYQMYHVFLLLFFFQTKGVVTSLVYISLFVSFFPYSFGGNMWSQH